MSLMLSGYSEHGCQEFIMPEKDNSNHCIILDHSIFGTIEDIYLYFDIIDSKWRFLNTSSNCVLDRHSIALGKIIESGDIIHLSEGSIRIAIIAIEFSSDINGLRKFKLENATSISIGTEHDNNIIVRNTPLISRHHAILTMNHNSCVVLDQSSNGTFVNGRRVHGSATLEYGDCISLFGVQLIWLGNILAVGNKCGQIQCSLPRIPCTNDIAPLNPANSQPNEKHYFRRSPRNMPQFYAEKIEIDAPPQPQKTVRRPLLLTIGPSLTMALPMIIGTGIAIFGAHTSGASASLYMYTGIIIAVLSALIGTAWALINLNYSKKQESQAEELRSSKYKEYLDQIETDIQEKYTYNSQSLNYTYPSAATCAQYNCTTPDLWNRNTGHSDFLFLRLGTGNLPFQCPITVPQQKFSLLEDDLITKPVELLDKFKYLKKVPIGIDLTDKPIVGIIGAGRDNTAAIMRNLVVQAASNICYTDLKMVFLFDGNTLSGLSAWSFAKWLPHVWSPNRKIRYFAADENERSEVCFYLANVLRQRAEEGKDSKEGAKYPHYIVFVSSPEILEGLPVSKFLLGNNGNLGVTTVLLAERLEQLPNSCTNIIENDIEFSGIFSIGAGTATRIHIDFDCIDIESAERFARSISGVEVQETENGGEIPDSLSFLDMYQVNTLDELNIAERWLKNRTYESMRVPIGQKAGGTTLNLDIHENYHGPHGLVAGTTGSGKSETLQTYILSLAVNFSPLDIAFCLIDFKGGGMSNLFSVLPHMAGHISNLSGNQIHRAMVSIKSENQRRQRIFGEFGVNHIDQYTKLFKCGEATASIPHLFIIIDEFAELKRNEPDFMRELISVAQVGRSLGVHLILATQKPNGTVDDNIWSNTRFRLCLRVQDKQDSNDVLHRPDAAFLTQAGRCYMQVGNDEIYELFQSAWSGAAYHDDPTVSNPEIAHIYNNLGQLAIANVRRKQQRQPLSSHKEETQLSALVNYLSIISEEMFADRDKFFLWLPPLTQEVYLFDLPVGQTFNGEQWPVHLPSSSIPAPVGIYDDPVHQAQGALVIDLATNGHLAVCGTVTTGKSTFLQTFLFSLVNKYSPNDINIYALDYSNRLLEPFAGLCHVGDVIFDDEFDKTEKLFVFLSNMMAERKQLLQGGNYAQYIKANGCSLPRIILIIDNYAGFREKTANKFEENLITLSREGLNYGLYLVVTSGGFGAGELPSRIADNFRSTICLEMGDRFKYSEILKTHQLDVLPEQNIKGRCLASVNGEVLECQIALSHKAADDYARAEKLRICFSEMNRSWSGKSARKIPMIPKSPVWDDLLHYEEIDMFHIAASGSLPFAWNQTDATIACIDLSRTYCWLITGKARTGKTNLLKVLAASAALVPSKRHVIDFTGIKLRKFSAENQTTYISNGSDLFDFLKGLLPEFKKRNLIKQELLAAGVDEAVIYKEMTRFQPIFLFIDNLDDFIRVVYSPPEGVGTMAGFVENITEKGYLHNIYLFAAYDYSNATHSVGRKIFNHIISYKTGIHLGGLTASQRIFDFSALPYLEQSKATKPGTGLIPPDEFTPTIQEVVIPLLKG